MTVSTFREFLKLESASGIILVIAAVLAMILANSPLNAYYSMLIEMPVEVRVGPLIAVEGLTHADRDRLKDEAWKQIARLKGEEIPPPKSEPAMEEV